MHAKDFENVTVLYIYTGMHLRGERVGVGAVSGDPDHLVLPRRAPVLQQLLPRLRTTKNPIQHTRTF
eukprot:COSAG05_NODE_1010_length_6207_cov_3.771447_8_plen_67_part_00